MRKKIVVDSVIGLGVETVLLLPLALGYLIWLTVHGEGSIAAENYSEVALLALGGLLTAIPLVAFAAAALRLTLTVLGFFQYLAPSITLLLAIFVYGEPFQANQAVTFGWIWLALVIFSAEGMYHQRVLRRAGGPTPQLGEST